MAVGTNYGWWYATPTHDDNIQQVFALLAMSRPFPVAPDHFRCNGILVLEIFRIVGGSSKKEIFTFLKKRDIVKYP